MGHWGALVGLWLKRFSSPLAGFSAPQAQVVEIEEDSDDKQQRKRTSAIDDIFKYIWIHIITSFRNVIAKNEKEIPIVNVRERLMMSASGESAPMVAGAMSNNPNQPAARLVHISDKTLTVADRSGSIRTNFSIGNQCLSRAR
ncbi:hypothetical protein HY086_03715 [Candidatus Gottesmanbacteria bacterium]|nr:hypothetical protein [Candidatus Gottesmanbacteria bacterium]